jgi:hypothetical protein
VLCVFKKSGIPYNISNSGMPTSRNARATLIVLFKKLPVFGARDQRMT